MSFISLRIEIVIEYEVLPYQPLMLDTPDKNSRNVKSFSAHSSRIDDVRSLSDLFTLQAALLRRV